MEELGVEKTEAVHVCSADDGCCQYLAGKSGVQALGASLPASLPACPLFYHLLSLPACVSSFPY